MFNQEPPSELLSEQPISAAQSRLNAQIGRLCSENARWMPPIVALELTQCLGCVAGFERRARAIQ